MNMHIPPGMCRKDHYKRVEINTVIAEKWDKQGKNTLNVYFSSMVMLLGNSVIQHI